MIAAVIIAVLVVTVTVVTVASCCSGESSNLSRSSMHLYTLGLSCHIHFLMKYLEWEGPP